MDKFMGLMDSSPSNILTTVRRLQLSYGDEQYIAKAHLLRFPSCPQLLDLSIGLPRNSSEDVIEAIREQLAVVGGKFPSLSSLAFRFHSSSINAAALFDVLPSDLLAYKSRYGSSELPGSSDQIGGVACLPTLENLSLSGADVITDGTRSLGMFPTRLESFHTNVLRGADLLFDHLNSLPVLPLFRSLQLDNNIMQLHGDTPITQYIKRAGRALRSLSMTIWEDGDSFEKLALQYCTNLRHIFLKTIKHHSHTYLIELLSCVTSKDLITIDVFTNMEDELADEDGVAARALDDILAEPRFRNLTRFSVLDLGGNVSVFGAALLLASGRGILQDPIRATPRYQTAHRTLYD
ncbi:hypothetical protein B0H11DRAFT_2284498 [Mycena galericulata]|nr:hypothetical protein B0H11DRAFT_2284498 [Mycena galericulata]